MREVACSGCAQTSKEEAADRHALRCGLMRECARRRREYVSLWRKVLLGQSLRDIRLLELEEELRLADILFFRELAERTLGQPAGIRSTMRCPSPDDQSDGTEQEQYLSMLSQTRLTWTRGVPEWEIQVQLHTFKVLFCDRLPNERRSTSRGDGSLATIGVEALGLIVSIQTDLSGMCSSRLGLNLLSLSNAQEGRFAAIDSVDYPCAPNLESQHRGTQAPLSLSHEQLHESGGACTFRTASGEEATFQFQHAWPEMTCSWLSRGILQPSYEESSLLSIATPPLQVRIFPRLALQLHHWSVHLGGAQKPPVPLISLAVSSYQRLDIAIQGIVLEMADRPWAPVASGETITSTGTPVTRLHQTAAEATAALALAPLPACATVFCTHVGLLRLEASPAQLTYPRTPRPTPTCLPPYPFPSQWESIIGSIASVKMDLTFSNGSNTLVPAFSITTELRRGVDCSLLRQDLSVVLHHLQLRLEDKHVAALGRLLYSMHGKASDRHANYACHSIHESHARLPT